MPQLLVELFSEEIPARMQGGAARDLERMASERLKAAGLTYDALTTYAGPRRLTLVVEGLPAATPDREEELKGPRTSAPEQALDGFLRKTGLGKDQLSERDGVWFAVIASRGVQTTALIPEMVDQIVRTFPWPKSMRWGTGTLRWVRPLKRIVALFDGAVVPFEIDGIHSGDVTEGHRFLGTGQPFSVSDASDYFNKLQEEFVIIGSTERRVRILREARAVCAARGLALVDDDGLLEEVAGLAEWPTPILGEMDPQFLDLPPEVVRLSMKVHQKYFAVRQSPPLGGSTAAGGEGGKSAQALAPNFVVVANVEASDGGAALAAGNSRVLSARLNDARFFWDEDLKTGFEVWSQKLSGVTFHAKLGTLAERVDRIAALAREIAPLVGADPDEAERAARLAKADLASAMVGEFPELQGVMGGYYARAAGERDAVADAIRDHYKPQGPADTVPTAPLTVAVALADKLDTLVGFFAIDEKPTGSKDPFALRRAALGVIRLVLDNCVRVSLGSLVENWSLRELTRDRETFDPETMLEFEWDRLPEIDPEMIALFDMIEGDAFRILFVGHEELSNWRTFVAGVSAGTADIEGVDAVGDPLQKVLRTAGGHGRAFVPITEELRSYVTPTAEAERHEEARVWFGDRTKPFQNEVLAFFADRLKVLLRDQGKRHDLVDAVFALGDDDLVRIVRRVEALDGFLATDDGANLLAGYKRASNILRAEEKKGPVPTGMVDMSRLVLPEEQTLAVAVDRARSNVDIALESEDFAAAMTALAGLRGPVDAFFTGVMVNSDVPEERDNRLKLLGQVRHVMGQVADFSMIAG